MSDNQRSCRERIYLCIDLKSFYASVECVERGLDPMTTNLVVADPERTEKTICLAVSPSMKALGVPNRCRVFQIPGNIDYIMATPRMKLYIDYSADIYSIYLKYIAKEDIHVYSIDEAFMDVTDYLTMYQMDASELGIRIMQDVFKTTGITAVCGIGTNLYLAKVALDITAKHAENHIGILDEESYRKTLWNHRPLKDFWRVGAGTENRLGRMGIYTMKDIAEADEDMLYRLLGIDAELLIDHAWGWEPCTIADVKGYRPQVCSLSSGQVLHRAYESAEALLVLREMADALALELVSKALVTDQIVLTVGYDIDNLKQGSSYQGVVKIDCYGRRVPQHAHGSFNLGCFSSSSKLLVQAAADLYERITDSNLLVRRLTLAANHVLPAQAAAKKQEQELSLFNFGNEAVQQAAWQRENRLQQAQLEIKRRFGKNSILKGMSLLDGATAKERNEQIGGHKA